jgi:hypothetical protein
MLHMAQVTKIHSRKTPTRLHYISEWAEIRGLRQVDFANELGADKGSVSRWFAGSLPEQPYIMRIAEMLSLETPNDLFRDPSDTWQRRLFENRTKEEKERMVQMLELAFPRIRSTK